MADMRVKMFLDLVNNTKGGAAQAKREMKGVKDAARDLNRQEAGKKIARDILAIANHSKGASRGLREVKGAAAGIGSDGASARLARDLEKARAAAARLRAELRGVKQQAAQTAGPAAAGGSGGTTLLPGTRGMLGGYLGIQAARAGTRGTVGQSVSREKAMADVRKKVDLPEGETFEKLERTITKFSITFGQSFENVAAIVAEAGAAGVAFEQLAGFTELATKASIAWDVPAREAAQKLFEIRAATQSTLPQLEEFADMINALGDSSAAKESSILEMFQRVGAAAKEAGVPIKTSLAFLTGIRSVGIGDEVGARAFGALTNKLVTADRSKKGTKALKEMGLDAKSFAKRMKTDATGALLSFFEALEKTPDAIGPLTDFVGNEWFDEVLRMKGAVAEIRKALALLSNPANYKGSATKTLNVELNTTANHLERLKALASDVGDRMGRWALPPINAAIERLIQGLNALDARDQDRKAAEDVGGKIDEGTPLTAQERQRMLDDKVFADRASITARDRQEARKDGAEKDIRNALDRDKSDEGMDRVQGARLRNAARLKLDREIQELADSLGIRDPSGRDSMLLGDRRKLEALRKRRAQIGPAEAASTSAFPDRSDADEARARVPRSEVMRLREQLNRAEERLRAIDALKARASSTDRRGYDEDAAPIRKSRADAMRRLALVLAPNATAASRFGTAPGGAPTNALTGATGSGLTGFGLNGFKAAGDQWKEGIRTAFEIDLGDAGMTLMERLRSSIAAGRPGVIAAAAGVKDGVEATLSGTDLAAAGQAAMATYAAGLRAGTPAAVAAAQGAAAQVKGALGGAGGRKAISGALHDGVD